MRKFVAEGEGINLKTGKPICFKIPKGLQARATELLVENIRMTRLERNLSGNETLPEALLKITSGSINNRLMQMGDLPPLTPGEQARFQDSQVTSAVANQMRILRDKRRN